jgi:hypothetical protein
MGIIIFIAAAIAGGLFLLLALYAPHRYDPDARPAIPLNSLREVATELLQALGSKVAADEEGDPRYLIATKREPLGEARHVVMLVPAPPGGVVDQATVLALVEDVKSERANTGVLITPGTIETSGLSGLEVPIQLLDGARFRDLVSHLRPDRVRLLDRYRGFNGRPAQPRVLSHQQGAHP